MVYSWERHIFSMANIVRRIKQILDIFSTLVEFFAVAMHQQGIQQQADIDDIKKITMLVVSVRAVPCNTSARCLCGLCGYDIELVLASCVENVSSGCMRNTFGSQVLSGRSNYLCKRFRCYFQTTYRWSSCAGTDRWIDCLFVNLLAQVHPICTELHWVCTE